MSRYLFAHEEDDLQHPGLRRNPEPESDYNSFRAGMQGHYTRVHWPVAQERMQKGWRIHSPLYGMVMRWGTDEQKQLVKDYVQQQPGGLFGGREKLGGGEMMFWRGEVKRKRMSSCVRRKRTIKRIRSGR